MNLFPKLILLSGLAVSGCGDQKPDPQVEAVKNFYTWRIQSRTNGIPSASELSEMTPYLSMELRSLLSEVRLEYALSGTSAEHERTVENGDWFTSMFDGPTSFTVDEVQSHGAKQTVTVRFTSAKELPAVNWRDRILVIEEEGRHVIADIEYENHWAFEDEATLIEVLKNPQARRKRRS